MKRSAVLGVELTARGQVSLRRSITTILFITSMATATSAIADDPTTLDRIDVWGPRWAWLGSAWWFGSGGTSSGYDGYVDFAATDSTYNDPKPVQENLCDNPVDIVTGRKFDFTTDFIVAGSEGLKFERTYNPQWVGRGMLGYAWVTNFDLKLSFDIVWSGDGCYPTLGQPSCAVSSPQALYSHRESGDVVAFEINPATNRWEGSSEAPLAFIESLADGKYKLVWPDGGYEIYRADGFILSRIQADGTGLTFYYDGSNRLTKVAHTSGRDIDFELNAAGRLQKVIDPANNEYSYLYSGGLFGQVIYPQNQGNLTYYYEGSSQLRGIGVSGVRKTWYTYNGYGQVVLSHKAGNVDRKSYAYFQDRAERTDSLGRKATYFTSGGRISGVDNQGTTTCPSSYAIRTFDANGRLNTTQDEKGVVTDYDYNTLNQIVKKVEAVAGPEQRTTLYAWNAQGRLASETLVGVMETEFGYTSEGWPMFVRRKNLSSAGISGQILTTSFTYNKHPNGMVASVTMDGPIPGKGDAEVRFYNASGNLTTFQDSLGHTTSYTNYSPMGQLGRVTNVNGAITDYTYDVRGKVTAESHQIGGVWATTAYSYDNSSRLIMTTAPDGVVTHHQYDSADRLVKLLRDGTGSPHLPAGAENAFEFERYTYNLASQITQVETGLQYTHVSSGSQHQEVIVSRSFTDYDEGGFIKARRGNNGQNVRYTYDAKGNVRTMTDSVGNVTTYGRDALDRLIYEITPGSQGTSWLEYDKGDRVTKVTDRRSLATSYVYDGFGQLWSQTSPDTGTTTFEYSAAGLRTKMIRNDQSWLGYWHDGSGRVTTVGNNELARDFTYDWCESGKGQLCGMAVRDAASNIPSWSHFAYTPQGQLAVRRDSTYGSDDWTRYSYDGMGRLTRLEYPTGLAANYGYSHGRLTRLTATLPSGSTVDIATGIQYQPFGPATGWTYGNGIVRGHNYDLDGRLRGISSVGGTAVYQSLTYGYDARDLITAITNGVDADQSHQYQYDDLGRLTRDAYPGDSTVFVDGFDGVGNRTSRTRHDGGTLAASLSYPIQPTSNRMSAINGTVNRNLFYNSRGHLESSSGWLGNRSYIYDSFDRLKSTTVDGITTSYLVNALDQRVDKTGPLGTFRYVYTGQNTLLGEHGANGWKSYLYLHGQPVAIVMPHGQVHYIHTDHLGRPESATRWDRLTVWKAANGSYSRTVTTNMIGGISLGFPGQFWDEETGTWHNGFRDYDPHTGRYLQSDPIGLAGGVNTYTYVGGNPISRVDPLGLEAGGGYSTGQYQMGQPSMSKCEAEALVNFGVDSFPITAIGSFALDLAGVDINLIDNPGVQLGDYGIDTPYAAAGHAAGAVGYRYGQTAARQAIRAQQPGIHYSVANGRANRAAASTARSLIAKGVAKRLGVVGAAVGLYDNLQQCGCQ